MSRNRMRLVCARNGIPGVDPETKPLRANMVDEVTITKGEPLGVALRAAGGVPPYQFDVLSETPEYFREDDVTLDWVNNQAVPVGEYQAIVKIVDAELSVVNHPIVITVNAAAVTVPGVLQNTAITPINPTTALVDYDDPATGDPPTAYLYSLPGGDRFTIPASRRVTNLPEGRATLLRLWATNDAGDGEYVEETADQPDGGSIVVDEASTGGGFDEVDRSTYTRASAPCGAGGDDNGVLILVFSQAGVSHTHSNPQLVGNMTGVTITKILDTGAARNLITAYVATWPTGKPATSNVSIDIKDAAGSGEATAQRCAIHTRPLRTRNLTPIASGYDDTLDGSNALGATIASVPEGALVISAISTTDNAVDCVIDMYGVNPEAATEGNIAETTALQYQTGTFWADEAKTSYAVGGKFANPATGDDESTVLPRFLYLVFDVADDPPLPENGVQAEWSDNFVEAQGIGLHTDWARTDGPNSFNIWTWTPGLAGPYGLLNSANNPRGKNIPHLVGQMKIRYFRSKYVDGQKPLANLENLTHDSGQTKRYFEYLYKVKGMRQFGPLADEGTPTAEIAERTNNAIAAYYKPTANPRYIPMYGIEGLNESNKGYTSGWANHTHTCQKIMYGRIVASGHLWNATTKPLGIACIMPSIYKRELPGYNGLAAAGTGNGDRIWDYSTHGCIHIYNGGREPTRCAPGEGGGANDTDRPVQESWRDAQIINKTLPVNITEMGFRYANPQKSTGARPSIKGWSQPYTTGSGASMQQFGRDGKPWLAGHETNYKYMENWPAQYGYNNISWYSASKYMLRMLIEWYCLGKGTDTETGLPYNIGGPASLGIYNFCDDVDTRPGVPWGLCTASEDERSVIPKPPYYAVCRMNDLLAEKVWRMADYSVVAKRHTWDGDEPTLGALDYVVTNPPAKLAPRVPGQQQPGWVCQRGNNLFLCLFTRDVSWGNDDRSQAQINAIANIEEYKTDQDFDFRTTRQITFGQTWSRIDAYEPAFGNGNAYPANGDYTGTDLTSTPRKTWTNVSQITYDIPDHPVFFKFTA